MSLELTREAKKWLAEHGYDKTMGARPMSRLIQEQLKKELANELLFGELTNGGVAKVGVKKDKLVISFEDKKELKNLIILDNILYLEADGMYTKVYLANREKQLICKPLVYFENQLHNNNLFFRCHRSYLINLHYLDKFVKKDGDFLLMRNHTTIPISKTKKQEFLKIIKEVF